MKFVVKFVVTVTVKFALKLAVKFVVNLQWMRILTRIVYWCDQMEHIKRFKYIESNLVHSDDFLNTKKIIRRLSKSERIMQNVANGT